MKVVADRDIPFLEGVLEPFAEVAYMRGDRIGPSDVRDADALLIRTRTKCDAALLEGSRVKLVGTATIGYDHINTAYCARHGISVATAAGSNARGVLQWVAAALAWLAGGGGGLIMAQGGMKPSGTILGVVGVGNVGSLVAKYAASWGFRVMCSDPPRERAEWLGISDGFYPMGEIVAACDIITFHVPLTVLGCDATRHIVDREFIASTRPGAVMINSSRGEIIEPQALRKAVAQGVGVRREFIIDTWNDEPDIDRQVLADALLGTPHIAGYSVQGKATATAMVVDALAKEFGLPLRVMASGDGTSGGWFPEDVPRSVSREISWAEMCRTMPAHFDIAAESAALKAAPGRFEAMRDNYDYRVEYF